MDDLPNPLQINFGHGKIRISNYTDNDGAGIMLFPDLNTHTIGEKDNSISGPHIPHKGEVYLNFSNIESLDVVISALEVVRTDLKTNQGNCNIPDDISHTNRAGAIINNQ